MKKLGVKHTIFACYAGYIVQALIANFAPLLFVTFHNDYQISLTVISSLIFLTFCLQLIMDLCAPLFIHKMGYRACAVTAHLFAATGMILLAVLPNLLPSPAVGLVIATSVYAVGGGLIEVIVSPLVEACPTKNKKASMSLLHSFYCWGQVLVVALSTLYFVIFGVSNWIYLALAWAALPLLNSLYFLFVPIHTLEDEGESMPVRSLLKEKSFWLFAFLFLCAGASELAVSQWSSAFAEEGLGVSKATGDLLGPCLFAVCMGAVRLGFSLLGDKIKIRPALMCSALVCLGGYALCAFAPLPQLGLVGCGVVGAGVALMWPGTLSYAAEKIPKGGTAMFALLALFGDGGCMLGPTVVGSLADVFGGNLATGIAFGMVVPALMFLVLLFTKPKKKQIEKQI